MPRPARQDLSKAVNGTITGRGGNVQKLGAAAMRRMSPPPPGPTDAGVAKRIPDGPTDIGVARPMPPPQFADKVGRMARRIPEGAVSNAPGGSDMMGADMVAKRIPSNPFIGGGMASYLRPPMERTSMELGGEMPPEVGGLPPDFQAQMSERLGGVNSNAFAENGGMPPGYENLTPEQKQGITLANPNGGPPPGAAPGAGQRARIAALIARLQGGGGMQGMPTGAPMAPPVGGGRMDPRIMAR